MIRVVRGEVAGDVGQGGGVVPGSGDRSASCRSVPRGRHSVALRIVVEGVTGKWGSGGERGDLTDETM